MTDQISFPPLHDLSPGEHEARKQHLPARSGGEPDRRRLSWPTVPAASPALCGARHRRGLRGGGMRGCLLGGTGDAGTIARQHRVERLWARLRCRHCVPFFTTERNRSGQEAPL